jgi:hypothetical protein
LPPRIRTAAKALTGLDVMRLDVAPAAVSMAMLRSPLVAR